MSVRRFLNVTMMGALVGVALAMVSPVSTAVAGAESGVCRCSASGGPGPYSCNQDANGCVAGYSKYCAVQCVDVD